MSKEKKESVSIHLEEAQVKDAEKIIDFTREIGGQTDNLTYGAEGVDLTVEQEAMFLESMQESDNQIMLVAFDGDKIVGLGNISASPRERLMHVGELGISVHKDYWGVGIGKYLMDELLYWAKEGKILRRIELDVRVDNVVAIHLYKSFGFEMEGTLKGVLFDGNKYWDVYRMALMI